MPFCTKCGIEISEDQETSFNYLCPECCENEPEPKEIKRKCPNCYNPIYKKQMVCTKCGLELRRPVGEPRNFFQLLIKLFGIMILVAIVVLIISSFL